MTDNELRDYITAHYKINGSGGYVIITDHLKGIEKLCRNIADQENAQLRSELEQAKKRIEELEEEAITNRFRA